jgi:DNA-binding PadR family transcriptional regulator
MNARLLILGVLHRGNFHPYEIKHRLKKAMVECYIDINVGTLYYAIRQLVKEGLIAAVSRERVARGGVRTVYRITSNGRAQFQTLLHAQFGEDGPVAQTLYGALLFLHLSDLTVVEEILHRRLERLDELIAKLGAIRDELAPNVSTGGEYLLQHIEKQRRLDRAWLKDLLADVKARRVHDVSDPKRLAGGADGKK